MKELILSLVDDEETYGECGYYMATLEAATQHLIDLAGHFSNSHVSDSRDLLPDDELEGGPSGAD